MAEGKNANFDWICKQYILLRLKHCYNQLFCRVIIILTHHLETQTIMGIIYKNMGPADLHRIAEIDRAEEILESYYMQNGELCLRPDQQTVTHFDKDELDEIIHRQHKLINTGGRVIGAFDQNTLVGVASVNGVKRGVCHNYLKMDILYVSRSVRGQKVGQNLLEQCKAIAKRLGAEKLYISATPTKGTVDFYLKNGAVITKEIDPELFALEPEDIHLELKVG